MLGVSCRKGTLVLASGSGLMCPHGPVYLGVFILLVFVSRKGDAVYPGCTHVSGNSLKLLEGRGLPMGKVPQSVATNGTVVLAFRSSLCPCYHDELPMVPRYSCWILSPTTSGQQSSDFCSAAVPRTGRGGLPTSPLHPSESRHSPIVTRLPPRGQDHKVLGLGITAQGRADDVVDGIILIHLLYQLYTPVGRLKSGLRSHSKLSVGSSSARL